MYRLVYSDTYMRYFMMKDRNEPNKFFVVIKNKYSIIYHSPKSMSVFQCQKMIYEIENCLIPVQVISIQLEKENCLSETLSEDVRQIELLPPEENQNNDDEEHESNTLEISDNTTSLPLLNNDGFNGLTSEESGHVESIMEDLMKLSENLPKLVKIAKEKHGSATNDNTKKGRRRSTSSLLRGNSLPD